MNRNAERSIAVADLLSDSNSISDLNQRLTRYAHVHRHRDAYLSRYGKVNCSTVFRILTVLQFYAVESFHIILLSTLVLTNVLTADIIIILYIFR